MIDFMKKFNHSILCLTRNIDYHISTAAPSATFFAEIPIENLWILKPYFVIPKVVL